MRRVLGWVAIATALAVAVSFLGAVHAIADSVAVFRVPLSCIALLSSFALRPVPLGTMLAGAIAAVLAWHGRDVMRPQWQGQARLTLYQQNLYYLAKEHDPWLAHLGSLDPDVVTLQELGWDNSWLLDALRPDFPHQLHCPLPPNLGEAILSRHPFRPGTARCSKRDGLAVAQLEAPGGAVWVVSVHLMWPWPFEQARQVREALPLLADISGPVVMAGDFNAVARSRTVRILGSAVGATRVGAYKATFRLPIVGLPVGIDHVLSNGPGRIAVQPRYDSDHNGVWAELDPWSD